MRNLKRSVMVELAATLVLAAAAPAPAQSPMQHTTFFTFSQPVRLPGVTLPAGRYMFQIAETGGGSRNVVQVFTGDRSRIIATLLAISAERKDTPEDPEVRFMEASANTSPAIRTWWYPGNQTGHEFIYPRGEALQLAKATNEAVLTTKADAKAEDMKTAELSRVSPGGEDTGWVEGSGVPATEPSGMAQRGDVQEERTAAVATSGARQRLPQTAGATPAVATLGLTLLGLAAGLRLRRRERS